ncbi:hypothetical protein GNX18_12675 [Microbulbifer sp. SH-1]|uniref:hypothetical protein n=1 Tax=Microbulbifer sp. SH-1 TaxID=2681547 RepID=UPI001408B888|nr:hypothetical protein [Microbulbifer sp. SH-1]QIL90516.1 hypothetical protein GNX18_12675 [Microbulbifer sp. SH-1]
MLKCFNWAQFLHGSGHNYYEHQETKELYGKQLLSLSAKLLWAMFAPFLALAVNPEKFDPIYFAAASLGLFISGLYLRHQGLKIIDECKCGKFEIYTGE